MLVLTRHEGEIIVITNPSSGERVQIKVVSIDGARARIGIDAPKDWPVHRSEIQNEVDARAARLQPTARQGDSA